MGRGCNPIPHLLQSLQHLSSPSPDADLSHFSFLSDTYASQNVVWHKGISKYGYKEYKYKLEKVAIIATYCHLRPPDAISSGASNLNISFLAPNFLGTDDPNFSTADCQWDLLSTVWQSLVEFCLLISVYDAWQLNEMQNLRTVGENSLPIWSRLWTKVHVVSRRCRRPLVVCQCTCPLVYILFRSEDIGR